MLYLTILEGPSAEEAKTILATSDQSLIDKVASAITNRLSDRKHRITPIRNPPSDEN